MIQAMRQLALDFLYNELEGQGDAELWYQRTRENELEKLFPYLVEKARDSLANNYYVLYADPDDDNVAILEQRVRKEGDIAKLPFIKTPPRSPDIGPVIKRSHSSGAGGGPKALTLRDDLNAFKVISEEGKPWSKYFGYVYEVLSRSKMKFSDRLYEGALVKPALFLAVEYIPEKNTTALLSILDEKNRLPGEVPEYLSYLQALIEEQKYARAANAVKGYDSLSGKETVVYPNGLAGAGFDITNMDRPGVFSNLDEDNAWKKFALSAENADLIYAFSFHVRENFLGWVAGEKALVLPHLSIEQKQRQRFIEQFKSYITNIKNNDGLPSREKSLLWFVKDHPDTVLNITLIWASFGQSLNKVTGVITDILPSRLNEISKVIDLVTRFDSPIFPIEQVKSAEPDLGFNSLGALLYRPGGNKSKKANESARLFELKRDMAARTYHARVVPVARFWDEVMVTARAYLTDAAESGNTYGFLNEGSGKKGAYLTLAGWTKHLAQYLYFLRQLEVYPQMSDWHYEPEREELKSFFADTKNTAGLDSPDKVYAFLLGTLFGKVMEVQGARGVNVGANALTWLKRLNMEGRDLPALYNKVREKLLTYNTGSRKEVRAIIEELGRLGVQIGTPKLSKTDANYYLLLGQSLTKTLIPGKEKELV